MSQQSINLGTADRGNGDPLRVAFDKVNDNFTELYNGVVATGVVSTSASPPVSPGEGDLWWDSGEGNLYVYYQSNWIGAYTGSAGPDGLPGAQGIQGPAGIRGLKGNTGDIGPRGYTGETGTQGEVGPRGLKGDQGEPGPAGTNGVAGETGTQGETGPRGVKGDTGDAGAAGLNGTPGIQGTQGIQGETGPRGLKGDTGESGANGLDGADGTDGLPGEQGLAGVDGADGADGIDGLPGVTVQFSETAPLDPTSGDLWWNTIDGNLYLYFSSAWISATSLTASYFYVPVPAHSVGQPGDTAGLVAYNSSYFYLCYTNYDGSTNIWKRILWNLDTW